MSLEQPEQSDSMRPGGTPQHGRSYPRRLVLERVDLVIADTLIEKGAHLGINAVGMAERPGFSRRELLCLIRRGGRVRKQLRDFFRGFDRTR